MFSPITIMAKLYLPSFFFYVTTIYPLFLTLINPSTSARTLEHSARHRHYSHHNLSFLMRDVLNMTNPSSKSTANTMVIGNHLPFSKPLGFFPPSKGIPIPETYTMTSPTIESTSTIGISFPARATLQELEYGVVTKIHEILYKIASPSSGDHHRRRRLEAVGKLDGFYVENSEDGGGNMVAMTMYFGENDELNDGVRLFGVYKNDMKESHIAVIGGNGNYLGANGYATLKKLEMDFRGGKEKFGVNYNLLEFNVYLSK